MAESEVGGVLLVRAQRKRFYFLSFALSLARSLEICSGGIARALEI